MTAKNKQIRRKRRARGIAVGNRYRVDAYFEKREQIEAIDRCAKEKDMSRSRFVTMATLNECARHEVERKDGVVAYEG